MLATVTAGRFVATCDKCRASHEVSAISLDEARRALFALAWFEAARKGRGRDRWDWLCPVCAPTPSTSFGRST